MASTPESSEWDKRYGVIEQAYCQGRWSTVMEAGTLLLRDLLEAGENPEGKALRYRMQLLMAHTLLHGYGDRDAAEDLYEVVRQSDAEAALRQIAADGLDQCHQPLMSPRTSAGLEEEDDLAPSRPTLFLPETEREGLEEGPGGGGAASRLSPLPQKPLIRVPPKAAAGALEAETVPEVAAVVVESPIPAVPTEEATDLGLAADPFSPGGGGTAVARAGEDGPVMPWLSEDEDIRWPEPAVPDPVPDPVPVPVEVAAEPAGRLIAEVVEEPELMEVHQADASLAEEVELPIRGAVGEVPGGTAELPEEDGELRTGLLLVVVG